MQRALQANVHTVTKAGRVQQETVCVPDRDGVMGVEAAVALHVFGREKASAGDGGNFRCRQVGNSIPSRSRATVEVCTSKW
jgi:hypothetical protein